VGQVDLPKVLNRAKIFVTTAQNGSLDKAVLEAMACGLPVISMAPGSVSLPLGPAQTINQKYFIEQIKNVLESRQVISQEYVQYVKQHHSLDTLFTKIVKIYVQ
jgi:glycosyltransferase involved in cell wall biosynthesis